MGNRLMIPPCSPALMNIVRAPAYSPPTGGGATLNSWVELHQKSGFGVCQDTSGALKIYPMSRAQSIASTEASSWYDPVVNHPVLTAGIVGGVAAVLLSAVLIHRGLSKKSTQTDSTSKASAQHQAVHVDDDDDDIDVGDYQDLAGLVSTAIEAAEREAAESAGNTGVAAGNARVVAIPPETGGAAPITAAEAKSASLLPTIPKITSPAFDVASVLSALIRLHEQMLSDIREYSMALTSEGRLKVVRAVAEGTVLHVGEVQVNPNGVDRVRVKTSNRKPFDFHFTREPDPSRIKDLSAAYLWLQDQLPTHFKVKKEMVEVWTQDLLLRRALFTDQEWIAMLHDVCGYKPEEIPPRNATVLPDRWINSILLNGQVAASPIFDASLTRVPEDAKPTRDKSEAEQTRFQEGEADTRQARPPEKVEPERGLLKRALALLHFGSGDAAPPPASVSSRSLPTQKVVRNQDAGTRVEPAAAKTAKGKPAAKPAVAAKPVAPVDPRPKAVVDYEKYGSAITMGISWHTSVLWGNSALQHQRSQEIAKYLGSLSINWGMDQPKMFALAQGLASRIFLSQQMRADALVPFDVGGKLGRDKVTELLADAGITGITVDKDLELLPLPTV